ncbi:hypothetical protein R1sor_007047 [Riccia sorocarpa]|uniref:Histone-lysine N-methyltransferase n=1 Tax=Riccia sorocarpa TaxID=122646 RepID=A0ABD3HRJ0_9MARC
MELEVWKLVMLWLDSQELANLAQTGRAMAEVVRSLTAYRAGDVTQGQETIVVPIVNDVDGCRYPNFSYTPFCQISLISSREHSRVKWGLPKSPRRKLVEADFGGAVTMGSTLPDAGCKCPDTCSTSGNVSGNEDIGRKNIEQLRRKRRKLPRCGCGRLVGGQIAYDGASRLRVLTKCGNVQSTGEYDLEEGEGNCSQDVDDHAQMTRDLTNQEQAVVPSSLIECGPACACHSDCKCRVSQHGVSVKLKVVRSRYKGWSLRANQDIGRGTFVCEYAGELVTSTEARERHREYDSLMKWGNWQGSALLVLREHLPSGRASVRVNIDATRVGNVARFINHSCDGGNLLPCIIRLAGCPIPKLGLFAERSIFDGEELTYSYGAGVTPGQDARPCFCGTSACLGTLPSEFT